MNSGYEHPRDEIAALMSRIYRFGLTTTSGGNLSIKDEAGDIWITPGGTDKGAMTPREVVRIHEGLPVDSLLKPSSELPFHGAIYASRPDARAVVHAHPTALVAFSVAGRVPDTKALPSAYELCGDAGFVPYALTGSVRLGELIAGKFAEGFDIVILENHGAVAIGESLAQAFERFETLENCARTILNAETLGGARPVSEAALALRKRTETELGGTFPPGIRSSRERELRSELAAFAHRAYERRLFTRAEGAFSARLDPEAFLITPERGDRYGIEARDIALVSKGKREEGTGPSRMARLYGRIYADHPDTGAIVTAQGPCAGAFAVSNTHLDSRTIPESFINLRDLPTLPYETQFEDPGAVSAAITRRNPVVAIANEGILATGRTILEAYDRLEVAEETANALLAARRLGNFQPIDQAAVREIEEAFGIPGA